MSQPIRIPNGPRVRLNDFDPGDATRCRDKDEALEVLQQQVRRMAELQQVLFAQAGHALLIVLQGMDGAGKDGTIRHVMSGLNPQGCRVTAFKVPTAEERAHDFLWRVHRETPPSAGSASSTARSTRTCWRRASSSSRPARSGGSATTTSITSRSCWPT